VISRDIWRLWSRKNLSPLPETFLIASFTPELTEKETVQRTPVNITFSNFSARKY
jgi:hypothetical protein